MVFFPSLAFHLFLNLGFFVRAHVVLKVQPVSVVSPDIHMGENIQNPPQDNVEMQDQLSTDVQGVDLGVEPGNNKPVPPVDV